MWNTQKSVFLHISNTPAGTALIFSVNLFMGLRFMPMKFELVVNK
jgi:hypothetical protein